MNLKATAPTDFFVYFSGFAAYVGCSFDDC